MALLSAVLCVRNEEERLESCLRRLAFADEIIVLLDRCTDNSEAIARRCGARIVSGEFPLEGPRRAAAVGAARGEWIIEVDADEAIGPELADEIRALIEQAPKADYFQVPIDNYVGERLIRYGWGGSFGTSSVARLFRRGVKTWGVERVHPGVRFQGAEGPILKNGIAHRVDADIGDMLRRFYKCYVTRKGYREGEWGVLIALMAALYPLISTLRARLESTQTRSPAAARASNLDARLAEADV